MSKKTFWVETSEFPANVQKMLDAFDAAFGKGVHNCVIAHWRNDSVFVQCNGILSAYAVSRFCQQNKDIYIELEAVAPGYWNVRLFDSAWMKEHEIPRCRRFLDAPPYEPAKHPYSVLAKVDAH